MPKFEPQILELAASGAVTTNAKPGILMYAMFTGVTVGDKLEINDGATTRVTLITAVANEPLYYDPPTDARPVWRTDIDAVITKTGVALATFIYSEVAL
jgi:hypothetical protein